MKPAWALLSAVLVAGCLNGQSPTASPSGGVGVSKDGLRPVGSDLRIDFGRAQDGVVAAVTKLQGAGPSQVGTNSECGAGPVSYAQWSNGLTLNFMDGTFLGWTAQPPFAGPSTVENLRVGTRIDALGVPLEDTSLGREFLKDGIWGLVLDGEVQVNTLWSGLTYFFR